MGKFEDTLSYLLDIFFNKPREITFISIGIFLSSPIIRWGILSVLYSLFKTPKLLEMFGESTAFNLLPWWVDFLTNPIESVIEIILIMILVTSIMALRDYFSE